MNSDKRERETLSLPSQIFSSHSTFSPWVISSTSSFVLHANCQIHIFCPNFSASFLLTIVHLSSSFIKPLAVNDDTFKLYYNSYLTVFLGYINVPFHLPKQNFQIST